MPAKTGGQTPPAAAGSSKNASSEGSAQQTTYEYSSRDVKPPCLLLADLERAHRIFLLHHAPSLSKLLARLSRPSTRVSSSSSKAVAHQLDPAQGRRRLVSLLARYWDLFLSTWTVSLAPPLSALSSGGSNPAADVWGGIRIAASGELGVGVGEEDRGSGEREVLEGFVGRIDGLVDLVVGKYGNGTGGQGQPTAGGDASSTRGGGAAAGGGLSWIGFGRSPEQDSRSRQQQQQSSASQWLGTGEEPGAEDGAIFLGVGALSRPSLRDVCAWMADLYTWGDHAYGVLENPAAGAGRRSDEKRERERERRRKEKERRRAADGGKAAAKLVKKSTDRPLSGSGTAARSSLEGTSATARGETAGSGGSPRAVGTPDTLPPGIPPSLIPAVRAVQTHPHQEHSRKPSASGSHDGDSGASKLVNFMKLGYGTYWSLGNSGSGDSHAESSHPKDGESSRKDVGTAASKQAAAAVMEETTGRYLIGLTGDIREETGFSDAEEDNDGDDGKLSSPAQRAMVRTVTVALEQDHRDLWSPCTSSNPANGSAGDASSVARQSVDDGLSESSDEASNQGRRRKERTKQEYHRLRVVVFACRPFLFVLLFRRDAAADLADPTLYRVLQHQLAPLRKPLEISTAYRHDATGGAGKGPAQVYDLVFDPRTLTVHSTIPCIPPPLPSSTATVSGSGGGLVQSAVWTRAEALSTHAHLLAIYGSTRPARGGALADPGEELERTAKTARGWWVVWSRVVDRSVSAAAAAKGASSLGGTDGRTGAGGTPGPTLETVEEEDDDFIYEDDDDYLAELAGAMENMHVGEGSRSGPTTPGAEKSPRQLGDGNIQGKEEEESEDEDEAQEALPPLAARVTKEIFLIRRAGDNAANSAATTNARNTGAASYLAGIGLGGFGGGTTAADLAGGGPSASWTDGASRLAQGIGVDTRKYIEGLLSLNR